MINMDKEDYDYTVSFVKGVIKVMIAFLLIVIILVVVFGTFYIINAGERGIVLTFGSPDLIPKAEGLHLKIPLVQKIIKMDIKTQKYEADASAASSDLQTVTAKMAINYHLESNSVPTLYKEVGLDYQSRLIQPLEQELVKATTARFTAEELITKREQVRLEIKNELHNRLVGRGIVVEEVSITNFDFSPSFNAAVESKVVNQQLALAQQNKLEQIKYEAEQRVVQARGEASAIQIQMDALNKVGGKDYIQLQAINKWSGNLPMVTGSNIPFLNIGLNNS